MKNSVKIHHIVYTALMAAIIYAVVSLLSFPFMGTKLHPSNVFDLLAGLILGPWFGGLAAGIGNFLYDIVHGYGILEALVTFAMKFFAAMLAGLISGAYRKEGNMLKGSEHVRVILGCLAGALGYVALYMLKTFVKQHYVGGVPLEGTWIAMLEKLPGSLINNGFAFVVTPILYTALRPALNRIGVIEQLRPHD